MFKISLLGRTCELKYKRMSLCQLYIALLLECSYRRPILTHDGSSDAVSSKLVSFEGRILIFNFVHKPQIPKNTFSQNAHSPADYITLNNVLTVRDGNNFNGLS